MPYDYLFKMTKNTAMLNHVLCSKSPCKHFIFNAYAFGYSNRSELCRGLE